MSRVQVAISTVYALWALAFTLLYAGGPLYVLGFGNSLIALWALVMLAHALAFGVITASGKGSRLLLVTAVSFTALNLWPAYLYSQWLPRGSVVRHLPAELLPLLHLAPVVLLAITVLTFARARVAVGERE